MAKSKHTYQIGQSGKIEQTQSDSVIAYSNGAQHAILIPRKLKRKIQKVFRMHGFNQLFIYYLFEVGIYYLISRFRIGRHFVVDTEYTKKDMIIKSFVTNILAKSNKPKHNIRFARIGNRPRAHYAAKDVYTKKKAADVVLTEDILIEALKKTDGRLRECLPTLVGARTRSSD